MPEHDHDCFEYIIDLILEGELDDAWVDDRARLIQCAWEVTVQIVERFLPDTLLYRGGVSEVEPGLEKIERLAGAMGVTSDEPRYSSAWWTAIVRKLILKLWDDFLSSKN